MATDGVKEIFERVLDWPADDQEKLARFVRELEQWRADDEDIAEKETRVLRSD
jgi:hypothetical protein